MRNLIKTETIRAQNNKAADIKFATKSIEAVRTQLQSRNLEFRNEREKESGHIGCGAPSSMESEIYSE
jgi:hypothetical protein